MAVLECGTVKEEIEMANVPPQSGQMLAEVVQGGCGLSVLADLQRPRAHSPLQPAVGERAGAEGLAQRTSTGPFQPHPPVWLCALLFLLKPLSSAPMPAGKGAGARDDPNLLPEGPPQHKSSPLHKTLWQTQSGEGKDSFIVNSSCRGPGVTAVQPVKISQHLQGQSQKALISPQRQEEAGFGSPLFGGRCF